MTKNAICLNVTNNIQQVSYAISSARTLCNDIDVVCLLIGNIDDSVVRLCKELGAETIDVNQLFEDTFTWFKEKNCQTCVHPGTKVKYSKYVFGRFLIPFVDKLKQYDKVLYMDNDCIVLKPLDELFNTQMDKYSMIVYDGQDIK